MFNSRLVLSNFIARSFLTVGFSKGCRLSLQHHFCCWRPTLNTRPCFPHQQLHVACSLDKYLKMILFRHFSVLAILRPKSMSSDIVEQYFSPAASVALSVFQTHMVQLDCSLSIRTRKIYSQTNRKGYDKSKTTYRKLLAKRI